MKMLYTVRVERISTKIRFLCSIRFEPTGCRYDPCGGFESSYEPTGPFGAKSIGEVSSQHPISNNCTRQYTMHLGFDVEGFNHCGESMLGYEK